jgi:hypothetical protein
MATMTYSIITTTHTHTQSTAATTWNITHNLNLLAPIVDTWIVINGSNVKVLPVSVEVVNVNNITITFSAPQIGTVNIT